MTKASGRRLRAASLNIVVAADYVRIATIEVSRAPLDKDAWSRLVHFTSVLTNLAKEAEKEAAK